MSVRRLSTPVGALLLLTFSGSATVAWADGFMSIHMDNQKIGSAVSSYWHSLIANDMTAASVDGFTAIHRDNQKIGSAVVAYWQAYRAVSAQDAQMAMYMDNQKFSSAVVTFWKSNWNPAVPNTIVE